MSLDGSVEGSVVESIIHRIAPAGVCVRVSGGSNLFGSLGWMKRPPQIREGSPAECYRHLFDVTYGRLGEALDG